MHLNGFSFDQIKIDGSLVRAMDGSSAAHAIVKAVVDMAKALGKRVVAEVVERQFFISRWTFISESHKYPLCPNFHTIKHLTYSGKAPLVRISSRQSGYHPTLSAMLSPVILFLKNSITMESSL